MSIDPMPRVGEGMFFQHSSPAVAFVALDVTKQHIEQPDEQDIEQHIEQHIEQDIEQHIEQVEGGETSSALETAQDGTDSSISDSSTTARSMRGATIRRSPARTTGSR